MNLCIYPADLAGVSDPTKAMSNAKTSRQCIRSYRVIVPLNVKNAYFPDFCVM